MSEDVRLPITQMIGYTPEELKAVRAKFERGQEHERLRSVVVESAKQFALKVNEAAKVDVLFAEFRASYSIFDDIESLMKFENGK